MPSILQPSMENILPEKFYSRPTLEVAKNLLGCIIVRRLGRKEMKAVITDVEAYVGEDDLASHASKGRTKRTEIMYGSPGRAYVYLVYGMYDILNIVTEQKDFPAAVMIRGVKIEGIDYVRTNGPGKVCRELKIDRKFNGYDIILGEKIWICKGEHIGPERIISTKRVGIDYAKHCREYPWRFILADFAGNKK